MKRVIVLGLLCCSMATMAQNEKGAFSIRPMAGVNLSDFSGGVSEDFYHMKAGLAVGVEAEYGISRSFGLSLGAFYSQMGAKVDGTLMATAVNDEYLIYIETKDKGKVTCNYITLPLMANFYVPTVKGLALKVGWNYEDFFFGEFLPEVEKKYNCGGAKGRRAVSGLSMGGGGSLVYAQRHPELFSSCYAMSPWLDNKENEVNTRTDGQDKVFLVREAVKRHSAIDFLSNADQATLAALRTVAWFVDCGDDDFLLQLSMDFHMKMREVKVHNELRVRNGVHNWEYWHLALRMSLPFASRNFGEN